jgi:hypothetical protein
MSSLVKNKEAYDAEEILRLIGKIQKYVSTGCEELINDGGAVLQIVDGFVIVAELKCINRLCEILSIVQWQALIYSHRLIRGAITAGEVLVTDDRYFIGPAIIDVYNLEKKNAIFPRIILANEIETYLNRNEIKLTFEYIEEDRDKIKYLGFVNYNVKIEKMTTKSLTHLLITEGVLNMLKTEYEGLLDNKKDIAQKYGWLINSFKMYGIDIV